MEFYLWMPGHHRLWTSEPQNRRNKVNNKECTMRPSNQKVFEIFFIFHIFMVVGCCCFWSFHSVVCWSFTSVVWKFFAFLTSDECNFIKKMKNIFIYVITNIYLKFELTWIMIPTMERTRYNMTTMYPSSKYIDFNRTKQMKVNIMKPDDAHIAQCIWCIFSHWCPLQGWLRCTE